jgi:hypothetical protein
VPIATSKLAARGMFRFTGELLSGVVTHPVS